MAFSLNINAKSFGFWNFKLSYFHRAQRFGRGNSGFYINIVYVFKRLYWAYATHQFCSFRKMQQGGKLQTCTGAEIGRTTLVYVIFLIAPSDCFQLAMRWGNIYKSPMARLFKHCCAVQHDFPATINFSFSACHQCSGSVRQRMW